jgi:hypothetical protein
MVVKIIFYISLVAAIILGVRVARILINDLPRLTEWGYGYLTGKAILFVFFGLVAFVSYRKMKKKK